LEKHESELSGSSEENTWKNWLYQMDLRNAKIQDDRQNNRIIIQPTKSPDVKLTPKEQENIEHGDRIQRLFILQKWVHEALRQKTDFPEGLFSAAGLYHELTEFLDVSNADPQKYALFQDILPTGCALLLKNHRNDLNNEALMWCAQIVSNALVENACREDVAYNEYDRTGSIEIAKILPTLYDPQDQENLQELYDLLSFLVACPNRNMRKAAGQAVRDYMWNIDVEFSEMSLRGAYKVAMLSKDFYRRWPRRTEEEHTEFYDQCFAINESILRREVEPIPSNVTFTTHDSWYLLPVLNIIPFNQKTLLHNQILDEATKCYLMLNERNRNEYDNVCADFQAYFPHLLGEHCYHTESRMSNMGFINVLFKNIDEPESFSVIQLMLAKILTEADNNNCLTKYWNVWNSFAPKIKQEIQKWASNVRQRNNNKSEQDNFISSFLFVNYWPDNGKATQQLHDLLEMNKNDLIQFIKETIVHVKVFEAFCKLYFSFPDIFNECGIEIIASNFISPDTKLPPAEAGGLVKGA